MVDVPGRRYVARVAPGERCAAVVEPVVIDGVIYGLRRPVALPALADGEARTIDVALDELIGAVHGVVVDPAGRPIADARVRVVVPLDADGFDEAPFGARGLGNPKTDARGAFRIEGLPAGVARVRVHLGRNVELADPSTVAVPVRGVADVGRIVAPHAVLVRGRVAGLDRARAVRATALLPDGTPDRVRLHETQTDAQGAFVLDGLAPGRYRFTVGARECPDIVTVPAQPEVALEIPHPR
jgi:hypothetical protein